MASLLAVQFLVSDPHSVVCCNHGSLHRHHSTLSPPRSSILALRSPSTNSQIYIHIRTVILSILSRRSCHRTTNTSPQLSQVLEPISSPYLPASALASIPHSIHQVFNPSPINPRSLSSPYNTAILQISCQIYWIVWKQQIMYICGHENHPLVRSPHPSLISLLPCRPTSPQFPPRPSSHQKNHYQKNNACPRALHARLESPEGWLHLNLLR